MYTTTKYRFAFITIIMDSKSLKKTDNFRAAIELALGIGGEAEKSDEDKTVALREVLQKYGHFFQTKVTLGGVLVLTDSSDTETKVTMKRPSHSTVLSSLQAKETRKTFESRLEAKLHSVVATDFYPAKTDGDGASFQTYSSEGSRLSDQQHSTSMRIIVGIS